MTPVFEQFTKRLDSLETAMLELKTSKAMHEELIDLLGSAFRQINTRFDALEGRVDKIEQRMAIFEHRMDRMELRMDRMEQKMDLILNALSIKA